jgi:hypothetical protein
VNPFTFADPKADLARFLGEAEKWKAGGTQVYGDDMRLRLEYYLGRQQRDLQQQLVKVFPETHKDQVPYYVPLTRFVVQERARVFTESTRLQLVNGEGEPLAPEDDVAKFWADTLDTSGLLLKLRNVDRYTELLRTVFLLPYREAATKARRFRTYFPQDVHVVFDPGDPIDLDRAWGVAFELSTEAGLSAEAEKRYLFYCARPEASRMMVLRADGTVERQEGGDGKNPFGLVPAVMFLADDEEVGAFSDAERMLVDVNRAVNVSKTDQHVIARAQGYGQPYLRTKLGTPPPQKMVRGPDRVLILPEGAELGMLLGSPLLDAIQVMIEADIKMHATLSSLSPGTVSLEGRAVASGVALQIERQPLTEHRRDRIDLHRPRIRRLWQVFRAVHNLYAQQDGLPAIPEDVELRWEPGTLETPTDPKVEQEVQLVDLSKDLTTQVEILMRRHGLSRQEAEQRLKENQDVNRKAGAGRGAPPPPTPGGSPLDPARARLQPPGGQRGAAPPPAGGTA